MFKKTLFSIAALGLSLNAAAFDIHESDGYVFGNLGYAKTKKPGVIKSDASYVKGEGGSTSYNGDNAAIKLGAGLNLQDYLALEVQYINLGKRDAKASLPQYGYASKGTLDTWGLGLNLVAGMPLGAVDQLHAFGKVGLQHMSTKTTFKETAFYGAYQGKNTSTRHSVAPSIGLGLGYAVTNEISLTAEYDYLNKAAQFRYYDANDNKKTSKNDVHMGSVGLRYSF